MSITITTLVPPISPSRENLPEKSVATEKVSTQAWEPARFERLTASGWAHGVGLLWRGRRPAAPESQRRSCSWQNSPTGHGFIGPKRYVCKSVDNSAPAKRTWRAGFAK